MHFAFTPALPKNEAYTCVESVHIRYFNCNKLGKVRGADQVSLTAKSRRWEILHSLWIGWTFTLGFFNWIAFLYVGVRARYRRWVFWGFFYTIPFALAMVFGSTQAFDGWVGDVIVALTLIFGVISIVHAFMIRKEYLLRLNALQRGAVERDNALKQRVEAEYGGNTPINAPPEDIPEDSVADEKEESSLPTAGHSRNKNLGQSVQVNTKAASVEGETVSPALSYKMYDYPFPLAFGYSLVSSKGNPRERYREQLRFAENILAFLASVSLVVLRELDHRESEIEIEEYWQRGISPGDWKDITGRCSKVFAEYERHPLASSICKLNIRSEKKGFGRDVAELIKEKNDFKHDRGPVVEEDIIASSNGVQEKLDRCMESLAFFTKYPIRFVQDVDVSRQSNEFILKCLRYTGDGPGFSQERITTSLALPRGDLFLSPEGERWITLYPFVTAMNCPRCKFREIYFIDRWDRKRDLVQLKSFERGHTEQRDDIVQLLKEWGNV